MENDLSIFMCTYWFRQIRSEGCLDYDWIYAILRKQGLQ